MPSAPLADNAALAWMIARDRPHYSPEKIARAVRIEDSRDTLGRKRAERLKREAYTPAIADSLPDRQPAAPDRPDSGPIAARIVAELTAAGLESIARDILAGESIRAACLRSGFKVQTVRDRIAKIRAAILSELASAAE